MPLIRNVYKYITLAGFYDRVYIWFNLIIFSNTFKLCNYNYVTILILPYAVRALETKLIALIKSDCTWKIIYEYYLISSLYQEGETCDMQF